MFVTESQHEADKLKHNCCHKFNCRTQDVSKVTVKSILSVHITLVLAESWTWIRFQTICDVTNSSWMWKRMSNCEQTWFYTVTLKHSTGGTRREPQFWLEVDLYIWLIWHLFLLVFMRCGLLIIWCLWRAWSAPLIGSPSHSQLSLEASQLWRIVTIFNSFNHLLHSFLFLLWDR